MNMSLHSSILVQRQIVPTRHKRATIRLSDLAAVMSGARHAESAFSDRVAAWVNEGGAGDDVSR
jgi:hypothetical protein